MKPTDELKKDHEAIRMALSVLLGMADKLEKGQTVPAGDVEQILDFIKTFADACHHGKEEDILFPAMVRMGFPLDGGPVAMMLMEHDTGRQYVGGMRKAFEGIKAGDQSVRRPFATAARAYVNLLNSHIEKENQILFPMAENCIPEGEKGAILEAFEKMEGKKLKEVSHEKFVEALLSLKEHYFIPLTSLDGSFCGH